MNKTVSKKDPPKRYVCLKCSAAFNRPFKLKQHEKIHENVKLFVCGEPNCNKSYTNNSHLNRHILNVHLEPAVTVIYSCPECIKVFTNKYNLKRHINTQHGRKTRFTCDVCSSSFNKKHLLCSHMYQHTFVKSFSCDMCSTEFITLCEKKKHMKHHKTYTCDLCEMAFVQWSRYMKHKKLVHTQKEYQCNDCGRKFKKRVYMVRHAKTHMTCYTRTFYPCTYENCDRVYNRSNNLNQHIKIKHLKVKHECEICSKIVSSKSVLLKHQKTHSRSKDCTLAPSVKTNRKKRCDKGIAKTSTALRIAGLLIDPEDENVKGTLKSIKKDTIADSTTEHIAVTDSKTEQIFLNSLETCDATHTSNMEIQDPLDVSRSCHEAENDFKEHSTPVC